MLIPKYEVYQEDLDNPIHVRQFDEGAIEIRTDVGQNAWPNVSLILLSETARDLARALIKAADDLDELHKG